MLDSHLVNVGLPLRLMLLKYSAKYCPAGHDVGLSSSVIVKTAVLRLPSVAPPVGLLSVRLTVSFPSASVSFRIGILTVLFVVSPSAKLTV